MVLTLIYWTLPLIFFLLLGFLSLALYVHHQHLRYGHIPGPPRDSFFTGNVPFFRREMKRDGEKGSVTMILINWYRQYGSVYVVWMFFIPVVILSDPDMAKKALITLNLPKEPGLYSKLSSVFGQRAAGQGILTEVDHDAWRLKRAMLEPGFHRKYLMNSMEAFNSICGDFLQNLRKYADGKTPIRMVDEFARVILDIIGKVGFSLNLDNIRNPDSPFPSAVSKTLEGMQANSQNPFWMFQISAFPFQNSVIEAIKYLRYFAKNVIEERVLALRNGKKTPNDILQHIVKEAQENSEIEMDDLVDNFFTIFTAGQETTLSQLSFTLYEVLNNPRIEERILKEVDEVLGHREAVEYEDLGQLQYLDQTLKEALRKYPPVPSAHRILQKEEIFGDFKIPAKTIMIVSCFNVHKSPEFWETPDDFDPDRFSPSRKDAMRQSVYFPFFLGPRSCLGKTLAQFEAKVVMSRALREFKFEILPGQTAKVEENITLRPRDGVICSLTQRYRK
ncbi:hypothetical protein ABFA07_021344 [Porites harrisoni]